MTHLQEQRLAALQRRLKKAEERSIKARKALRRAEIDCFKIQQRIYRYERLLAAKPVSHPDFYPPHMGGKPAYTMPVQAIVDDLNKQETEREKRRGEVRVPSAEPDKLEVPDFLKRSPAALPPEQMKEALAKEATLAEQKAENQKVKAQVRKQTKEARLRGQLKKMPLTGKEALAFIKSGA